MAEEENFKRFLAKKAYEIAYASFRVADVLEIKSLSDGIKRSSAELLGDALREKYEESQAAARELEHFLRLSGDTGAIAQSTILVILGELDRFASFLGELSKVTPEPLSVELGDVFSQAPLPLSSEASDENKAEPRDTEELQSEVKEKRQSAILEIIRQNGNLSGNSLGCRLKDIQDVLPGVSERTLRYDIQSLINQGVVERMGSGGPHTSYRTKNPGFVTFAGGDPL